MSLSKSKVDALPERILVNLCKTLTINLYFSMALAVGTYLQHGRYQIQDSLKATDVDITYQAVHTFLERSVVLKQLRSDVDWATGQKPTNQVLMTRLGWLSRCNHPSLVEILDCFEDRDRIYLVLPAYPSTSLDQWLRSNGTIAHTMVLNYLKPLVDAVEQLQQEGLLYGDWTLQSLYHCAQDNRLVMADLGWRGVLKNVLSDRHYPFPSAMADTHGLAQLAYTLLTGQTTTADWVAMKNHNLTPALEQSLTLPLDSTTLKPGEWFKDFQAAIMSSLSPATAVSTPENISSPLSATPHQVLSTLAESTAAVAAQDMASTPGTSEKTKRSAQQLPQRSIQQPPRRWLPYLLGAASMVAMVSGGVVGYTFRVQDVEKLEQSPIFGSEIFGSDQEFPPSDYWPGSDVEVNAEAAVLFEALPSERDVQPVAQTETGTSVEQLNNGVVTDIDESPEAALDGALDEALDENVLVPEVNSRWDNSQISQPLTAPTPSTDGAGEIVTPVTPTQPVVDTVPGASQPSDDGTTPLREDSRSPVEPGVAPNQPPQLIEPLSPSSSTIPRVETLPPSVERSLERQSTGESLAPAPVVLPKTEASPNNSSQQETDTSIS